MTPAARAAAAIAVLDRLLAPGARDGGASPEDLPSGPALRAEAALATWGRASRYAGSGDRRAVRDWVYGALRRRRSAAWVGGGAGGRGLVLGLARLQGLDLAALFDGSRHGPVPLAATEAGRPLAAAPEGVRLDCPDWLLPRLRQALGPELEAALTAGQTRGPLFLRASTRSGGREAARAALAAEGITARPHPRVATALEVTEGATRLAGSRTLDEGRVEPMDAHSQATVLALGPLDGLRVLDYCAGAGGKALMLADLGAVVTAHDAEPRRLERIAPRAARLGLQVQLAGPPELASAPRWPLVLADAPCSGSGTWRRDPEGKWALTPARLTQLVATQDAILDACALLVAPEGRLAFVTCSLLEEEGEARIDAFRARAPGWTVLSRQRLPLGALGDGFFVAILRRSGE